MPKKRIQRSARPVGIVMGLFFAAVGLFFVFDSTHPAYATFLFVLAVVWFALALTYRPKVN